MEFFYATGTNPLTLLLFTPQKPYSHTHKHATEDVCLVFDFISLFQTDLLSHSLHETGVVTLFHSNNYCEYKDLYTYIPITPVRVI